MKKLLAILLCATALHAQDHLKNFRNKTAKQIANVSHLLRMDTTFFNVRIGEKGRDLAAAVEARGLTPRDFATIKAALDTSIFRQNRLYFPPGTYSVDSLGIYSPITLSGVGSKRIQTTDVTYYGSILKSTNTGGLPLVKIQSSGVHLSDMSFQGSTGRTNGHGIFVTRTPNASGSISTTLGGYTFDRINSFNHGGDGIHLRGADGVIIRDMETYGNKGYGIAIVSPNYDGVVNAGNTAGGTTNIVFGGRTRANSLGGILIGNQAAPLLLGAEAIADTGYAAWFDDGRSRGGLLWADLELNVPKKEANPISTALRVDNYNGFLALNSYIGTTHNFGTYTADAGTNTTTIVDAALVNMGPDDYLTGSDIINTSRSSARRRITDYVASTGTLTLASAVTGQTTGDTYQLKKYLNRAIHVDSLASGIFINNSFDHESDTSFAVTGYGYATFFNNINFDPADDAKAIGGAEFKWLNYNLSKVDSLSGGDARVTSNTEVHLISSDSLVFRTTDATKGISLDTPARIGIQPSADNHVFFFENAADEERKELRIHGDANLSVGTLNKQYIRFAFSGATKNALTISNSADSIKVGMGAPLLISGDNQTERHIEFLNHSGGTSLTTPTNGLVRLYARGDTLYAKDDNGVERSLYAAAGASGDITDVTAGDGLSGGGTTGAVSLALNPKLSGQTIAITSDSAHVKDSSIGATQLSSTTVTPGSYTAADITVDADGRITAAASGAGGSGDITAVGDVASGAAFDGTQGTTLTFNNAGGDATQAYDGSVIAFSHALTVQASDPADAEAIRLDNAEGIAWEASPAGTDYTLKVDASEILQASGAFNSGGAITEATNAVPNATDHLGFFAATTSSQLAGVLSDETGTGAVVLAASPSLSGTVALASASVLNFNSSDVTVTHSSDALTVAGGDLVVPTEAYDASGWNGDNSVPTKDAVRDKIETISGGGADTTKWYYQAKPNGGLTTIGDKIHVKFVGAGAYPIANGDTININVVDLKAQALMFDDFCGGLATTGNIGNLGWSLSNTGSTFDAGQTGYATTTAPCWFQIQNNAGSANNRGQIFLASQTAMVMGGNMRLTARIKLAEVSAGTIFRFGFYDLTSSAVSYPVDGLFAEFNADSSANWRLVSSNGSTRTFDNSATAASTSITTIDIVTNSGYTQADLYINGVLTTGSITTNLPGSTAEGSIHFVEQTKDTSTRTVGIDFFSYSLTGISR